MPIVGRDAFRTATGVHAAAVIKAHKKGDNWLADRIYSGVPAAWLARKQEIEIGPMSGNSNVVHFLSTHGLPITSEVVAAVMQAAKHSSQILTLGEVSDIVRSVNPSPVGRRNHNGKRRQKLGSESAGDSDEATL
jgi:2-isopropylmalate synthase